jgi:uncharacterized protein (DUF1501 family)
MTTPHAWDHLSRRSLLGMAGLTGAAWLTPVAHLLARDAERTEKKNDHQPAQSVIVLWMAGGPSQLETFDPHPDTKIGGPTKAIATAVKGVQLAAALPRVAEELGSIALVRSLTTKEGDHERGTYLVKTGYVPDPTVVHPSIGAIICHQLPEELPSGLRTEIPRHVSILPGQWPGRGGDLGNQYDAFKTYDPLYKVPDVTARVPDDRFNQRLRDLQVVENAVGKQSPRQVARTLHDETVKRAKTMMTSKQLKAFEVADEPHEVRDRYGDTPFGRGCRAARRLIEVGVRCVEVTLQGWDTHASNFEGCKTQNAILDPAFAALIRDLRERKVLDRTLVLCGGEFGRTPKINGTDGRDHWPSGFSMALAGGGIHGGHVIGQTDPEGGQKKPTDRDAQKIEDIHATVLHALGIQYGWEYISRANRPIKLSKGQPIRELLVNG